MKSKVIAIVVAIIIAIALLASLQVMMSKGRVVRILGSGSTFVKPAMDAWIRAFMEKHPGVVIEYSAGGSGKGLNDLFAGLSDFSCSDPPLPTSKWLRYRDELLQFPIVLGAIAIVYNVPEIGDVSINLTGEVLAKIYLGEIAYWDDPMIKSLNPAIADKLPHKEIIVVHRSDASGTTQVFTEFLAKAYPRWVEVVGRPSKVVEWPVDRTGRGVGAEGNAGVIETIKSTPYSIGYVGLEYALEAGLPIAKIMNKQGKFVLPTPENIMKAFKLVRKVSPLDDWSKIVDDFIYSNEADAYPIVMQTFMILWRNIEDVDKCMVIKEFVKFIATEGQKLLGEGYVPLPPELREVALEAVNLINCGTTR